MTPGLKATGFQGMLPIFDGPGDASEKMRWWLAHDREREESAVQAREAIADRTFGERQAAAETAGGPLEIQMPG